MALFTGKGDKGDTYVFDTPKGTRISKSSILAEALGTLDEINSFLGLCKIKTYEQNIFLYQKKKKMQLAPLIHDVQENLFIIQAELAGAPKKIQKNKITKVERIINSIEEQLPPITTFFISGGTELASLFDVARTIARRAERRVVELHESGERGITEHTRAYLNRLSSLLYACARLSNHVSGLEEISPSYK